MKLKVAKLAALGVLMPRNASLTPEGRRGRGMKVSVLEFAMLLLLAAPIAGCGGSSANNSTTSPAPPAPSPQNVTMQTGQWEFSVGGCCSAVGPGGIYLETNIQQQSNTEYFSTPANTVVLIQTLSNNAPGFDVQPLSTDTGVGANFAVSGTKLTGTFPNDPSQTDGISGTLPSSGNSFSGCVRVLGYNGSCQTQGSGSMPPSLNGTFTNLNGNGIGFSIAFTQTGANVTGAGTLVTSSGTADLTLTGNVLGAVLTGTVSGSILPSAGGTLSVIGHVISNPTQIQLEFILGNAQVGECYFGESQTSCLYDVVLQ